MGLPINVNRDAYSYDKGPPRANWFADEVVKQLYGRGLPKGTSGNPVKFEALYSDPGRFGWKELAVTENKTGSVAVWPTMGGIVVADDSQIRQLFRSQGVQLLYSSEMLGGKVAIAEASTIVPGAKPKYLVPADGIAAKRRIEEELAAPNQDSRLLAWNSWFQSDPNEGVVSPTPILSPNSEYSLIVDLSAGMLESILGTSSRQTSRKTSDWLQSNRDTEARLKILMIPDSRFFKPPRNQLRELSVNLNAIRKYSVNAKPMIDQLRDRSGSFGRVSFRVWTRPRVSGTASIAFSVWVEGSKPVDEFYHIACVATEGKGTACKGTPLPANRLRGIDSARLASTARGDGIPDAAVHFVELTDSLVGVFRCNTCDWPDDKYVSWRVDSSPKSFADYYERTIRKDLQDGGVNNESFRRHCSDLFASYFSGDSDADEAKAEVTKFIESAVARETSSREIPSVFVRRIGSTADPAAPIPMGLAIAPIGPGREDHLGFHFRLISPLEEQDYRSSSDCISRWVLFSPGTTALDAAMKDIADGFRPWLGRFERTEADNPGSVSVYHQPGPFHRWLVDDKREGAPSTAVLILSHHEADRLFLSPADTVESEAVRRTLTSPSIVIIGACGGATPGAMGFVSRFNKKGAVAVIASVTNVEGELIAKYVSALLDGLDTHPDWTLWTAHYQALKSVAANERSARLPSAVLEFVLLGNGNLKVCPPRPDGAR